MTATFNKSGGTTGTEFTKTPLRANRSTPRDATASTPGSNSAVLWLVNNDQRHMSRVQSLQSKLRKESKFAESSVDLAGRKQAERALSFLPLSLLEDIEFEFTHEGFSVISWYSPESIATLVFDGGPTYFYGVSGKPTKEGKPTKSSGRAEVYGDRLAEHVIAALRSA